MVEPNYETTKRAGTGATGAPTLTRDGLAALARKLPPFPRCAAEVIRAARDGDISAEHLIYLSSHDQVLAGHLIAAANSAAYTWSGNVRTLEQAVLYLGEARATQVVLATAVKPILAVGGHQALWEHSLDVAHIAYRIASSTRAYYPSDAYVLGLLHDVGELLMHLLPAAVQAHIQSLVAAGATRNEAEWAACGANHCHAGADVLRHWAMPGDYVDAVEHHHTPDQTANPGAAVLYLAEQWTHSGEEELSPDRLDYAMKALGISSQEQEFAALAHPAPGTAQPRC